MAALDFPASPTDGQTFAGGNGVSYTYNAAKGLWLASSTGLAISVGILPPANPQHGILWWNSETGMMFIYYNDGNTAQWVPAVPGSTPVTATGDFYAQPSAIVSLGTSPATVLFNTVVVGNAGGWYNPVNGRFTPPAGRYYLHTGALGYHASSAAYPGMYIRKNGTNIAGSQPYQQVANTAATLAATATVDANGTDWFDVTANCNVAGGSLSAGPYTWFGAIPVGVVQALPSTQSTTPMADFSAFTTAALGAAGNTVIAFQSVYSGNSGGWYNPANGRFTPPAGRYKLTAWFSSVNTGSAHQVAIDSIRKNGVAIPNTNSVGSGWSANYNAVAISDIIVDANGTDYFEVCAYASTGTTSRGWFSASPVGVVTLLPSSGTFQLYSEQVLAAPAVNIDVRIPPTWKALRLEMNENTSGATDPVTSLVGLRGTTPDANNVYNLGRSQLYASNGNYTDFLSGQAQWQISGMSWFWSSINFFPSPSPNSWWGTLEGSMISGGTRFQLHYSLEATFASAIDGFRLRTASGNFNTGSSMRCFVVT